MHADFFFFPILNFSICLSYKAARCFCRSPRAACGSGALCAVQPPGRSTLPLASACQCPRRDGPLISGAWEWACRKIFCLFVEITVLLMFGGNLIWDNLMIKMGSSLAGSVTDLCSWSETPPCTWLMTDTFGIKKKKNAFHILYRELGLSLKGVCSLQMLSSLTAK